MAAGTPPAEMDGDQLGQAVAVCSTPEAADLIKVMAHDQAGGWRRPEDFGFEWGTVL
jgi:hypothetical protein